MVCLSTKCGAVVAYDSQLQGALTALGGTGSVKSLVVLSFPVPHPPAKQTPHPSPDTQAQWDV